MKLSEIGEYKLLQEYVMPLLNIEKDNIYDDCVFIKDKNIIWTTDPTPVPIAWMLGIKDPEIFGWYTGLINLSDIAADGGKPIGLLVSVEIPENYEVDYYMKFNKEVLFTILREQKYNDIYNFLVKEPQYSDVIIRRIENYTF